MQWFLKKDIFIILTNYFNFIISLKHKKILQLKRTTPQRNSVPWEFNANKIHTHGGLKVLIFFCI